MNILVTAGNTLVPIDRVRGITNVFTGRTGAAIALHAHRRGHAVTLLTSHPEAVDSCLRGAAPPAERWSLRRYRTFDDLQERMKGLLEAGGAHALVHCAAVSDYRPAGIYAPAPGTTFDDKTATWHAAGAPALADRAAGKVKSDEPELWLRLVRTPKLVDQVRSAWGFRGLLVKFKLEVGAGDEQLLQTAERSRQQSSADLLVANTLEGASLWAFLGPLEGRYERVSRADLAARLVDALERLHGGRGDG